MKVLKKYEFKARQSNTSSKYDWATFLNGQVYQLTAGEDYPTDTDAEVAKTKENTFTMMLRNKASDGDKKVRIDRIEGGLVIQAVTLTPEEIVARDQRREQMRIANEKRKAEAATNGSTQHETVQAAEGAPPA